jgi:hypothetical protein
MRLLLTKFDNVCIDIPDSKLRQFGLLWEKRSFSKVRLYHTYITGDVIQVLLEDLTEKEIQTFSVLKVLNLFLAASYLKQTKYLSILNKHLQKKDLRAQIASNKFKLKNKELGAELSELQKIHAGHQKEKKNKT